MDSPMCQQYQSVIPMTACACRTFWQPRPNLLLETAAALVAAPSVTTHLRPPEYFVKSLTAGANAAASAVGQEA